ncbi:MULTISPECIES: metallophosphoesterase [unclassified Methylobacterium]|uniref:metallophosphoesterase n=1 Tax=unclassified Methylobacterium TaxID=2615210 RepID=UPI001352E748|nr:metallophosphoesterase [Methylobacterium sp. 2A]
MTIFFTGDTHFGDTRVLRFDHRPYPDLEAHDAGLIAAWNETVAPGDTVWHLGDFALGPSGARIREILDGLNGEKHLIVGNNDGPDTLGAPGWSSVRHYAEFAVEGRMVVLCHYAFRTWNGMSKGALNLHGHSHGKLKPMPKQYDVGVDPMGPAPVALPTILSSRLRGKH